MDLTIVAVYTMCDDLLISLKHQDHPLSKMSDAEVMTTALVAARYFAGNQQTARAVLKTEVYHQQILRKQVEVTNSLIEQLLPKSIHTVTAAGFELKVFLFVIATSIKQLFR